MSSFHRLFSSCGKQRLLCSCGSGASHSCGSPCCGAEGLELSFQLQELPHVGSVVAVPGLYSTGSIVVVHGLSCFKGCGIEPVSPALAGRFLTTEPPGKPMTIS